MKLFKKIDPARLVFLALLAVMLDHTAFFFSQYEPTATVNLAGLDLDPGRIKGFAMALVFESSIWIMTDKLARHIESVPVRRSDSIQKRAAKFLDRYVNAYGLALAVCWIVSFSANYSHAVQFGQTKTLALFDQLGLSIFWTALVAGGILPFVSLLFSAAMARTTLIDESIDNDLAAAKTELAAVKRQLAAAQKPNPENETVRTLLDPESTGKSKILAARQLWPDLANNALAVIASVDPSHVTKTLQRSGLVNGQVNNGGLNE